MFDEVGVESKLFDDRELSKKIGLGNVDAFTEWYHADAPRLRLFLRHLLGNEQAAEDLMQETFIQIWRRPQGFDPAQGSLRAYLFGTARNLVRSWLRKQRAADELQCEPVVADHAEDNSMMEDLLRFTCASIAP